MPRRPAQPALRETATRRPARAGIATIGVTAPGVGGPIELVLRLEYPARCISRISVRTRTRRRPGRAGRRPVAECCSAVRRRGRGGERGRLLGGVLRGPDGEIR